MSLITEWIIATDLIAKMPNRTKLENFTRYKNLARTILCMTRTTMYRHISTNSTTIIHSFPSVSMENLPGESAGTAYPEDYLF